MLYIKGASCSFFSNNDVRIYFENRQPAGVIMLALLAYFNSHSPSISMIRTSQGSYFIDSTTDIFRWTLSSTNLLYQHFKFHAYRDISNPYPLLGNSDSFMPNYLNGADINNDLYWAFKSNIAVTWSVSTSTVIHLPLANSLSFTRPYIGYDFYGYELDSQLRSSAPFTFLQNNKFSRTNDNKIFISFMIAPTPGNYYIAAMHRNVALPYVSSNLGTFYECWAVSLTESVKEIGSSVYSVLNKDYNGVDIFSMPLCNANNEAGIPLMCAFRAKIMTIDFSSAEPIFQLEIQIDNGGDLGTGLAAGSSIPLYSSLISPVQAYLVQITNPTIILIRGLGTLWPWDPAINIFLAMGVFPYYQFKSISSLYYITSINPDIKNYLYQSTVYPFSFTNYVTNPLISGTSSSSWAISSASNFAVNDAILTTAELFTNSYIGVGLPTGFRAFMPTITFRSIELSETYYASNSNDYMNGGFVMGKSHETNYDNPTMISLAVTGLWAPGYAGVDHLFNIVNFNIFAINIYSAGQYCTISGTTAATGTVTVTAGSITSSSLTCSLSSVSACGPDSVDSTMTISLATLNSVPKNGFITLWLDSSWSYNLSICTVIGINGLDNNHSPTCTISSTTLVVTSFAGFAPKTLQIIIYHVLPPALPGTYDCVTAAATQDSTQNYIDYGSSLTQGITLIAATPVGSTSSIPASGYPYFQRSIRSDIYLSFSLAQSLPAGGYIDILARFNSKLNISDISYYCWTNIDYKSCILNDNKITIVLVKSIAESAPIQIYIDSALILPSLVSSSEFQIAASNEGITISII